MTRLALAVALFLLPTLPRPLFAQVAAETFAKHVVVAQDAPSANVGASVLRAGGNAVDAAVATAFALAVTHPAAGNLGGGGFLVAFDAKNQRVRTFDFRESAPAAATPKMYLGPDGRLLPHHRSGARAAAVPGTVRGLALAHSTLGKLPWPNLVRPAVNLARQGFPISAPLARSLNAQLAPIADSQDDRLADFPESLKAFSKPDKSPWRQGDILSQPHLAETLQRIANEGPDDFYTGATSLLIERYMHSHGGLITRQDLAAYRAVERPPIHTTFRGLDIYGMGPPSSGGIVLAQMLNILETFDLAADGPLSPLTLHRVAEAQRRAFFTRATQIADPDLIPVPISDLISKETAHRLAASILDRATPSASLASFHIETVEGSDTTHLSTLDSSGNAVALTYTLEDNFGAKAVVDPAGFLLNNEMGDFNLIPSRTDTSGQIGTVPNQIAPNKRMLSSQTPTIVLQNNSVRLVTGSPGGRTIPNTVLWIVLNTLEFHLPPRPAVDAPRTHQAWFPDTLALEGQAWDPSTLTTLKSQGHHLRFTTRQGDAHTIVVDPKTHQIHGIADKRQATEQASGD